MKTIVHCFKSLANEHGTLMTRPSRRNISRGRLTLPVLTSSANGWRLESVINLRAFLIMGLSSR